MKICHVVFSSNRLEYLEKTLSSNKSLNYGNLNVDTVLIDDYPFNRNDDLIKETCKKYKINTVILNKENLGITKNWQNFFDYVNDFNYDYILHQEDDVELLEKIDLNLLIQILESNKKLRQVQLKRNNWYKSETEEIGPKKEDIIFNEFRYEIESKYFWMMFSLYPSWICREPILQEMKMYPSEFCISEYLNKKYNLNTALLKNKNGKNIINHFGEFSQGKRVSSELDAGWNRFKNFNPEKKYSSKTGEIF
jgi:hypothetical protein